jgi:hypothetical protein
MKIMRGFGKSHPPDYPQSEFRTGFESIQKEREVRNTDDLTASRIQIFRY